MRLTDDERMMILLYGDGTRAGLIVALEDMEKMLQPDERELLSMTEILLGKLRILTDDEYAVLAAGK